MYFNPFWRILGSCSRLAAYVFHILWWPDLHDNIVIYTLFYYFLAPQIPLETLLTNPSLIREIKKTLYFWHVWQLSGSWSRLAAYVFHGLRGPNLHEHIVIYMLFDYLLAREFPSKLFWPTLRLSGKSNNAIFYSLFVHTYLIYGLRSESRLRSRRVLFY